MENTIMLLQIAADEAQTLVSYATMLNNAPKAPEHIKRSVHEIMSDEFNHAFIALILAAQDLGIPIAQDDISPDPNNLEVT